MSLQIRYYPSRDSNRDRKEKASCKSGKKRGLCVPKQKHKQVPALVLTILAFSSPASGTWRLEAHNMQLFQLTLQEARYQPMSAQAGSVDICDISSLLRVLIASVSVSVSITTLLPHSLTEPSGQPNGVQLWGCRRSVLLTCTFLSPPAGCRFHHRIEESRRNEKKRR